ncbi:hypothetical protein P171DRAFT_520353 [Karstenula rhodostoma CBS 690.94]|uniref:Uncharacterized protein n=1 Tax=Karstenula rhodostoma CBS 690.94 TaxID=1392251 RepID=A0A9P4PML7_9PLEO|nr:hypothetical protein P171DRAFT_520353 [Karstenula rhodostoma CBS 690.94]
MVSFFSVWLLAAYSSLVIAGPLPHLRHQFSSLHYLNTSSTSTIASRNDFANTLDLASIASSIPATQSIEANTAVMVEPIDHTVFTRTEAAITFVNPKGDPLVTQAEETVLSTSYITKPSTTETPTPKASPRVSSLAALETSTSTQDFGSLLDTSVQATTTLSERLSDNTTTSTTAPQQPMFTYEPEDVTTVGDSSRPTITITISSFTTLTAGLDGTVTETGQPSVPVNSSATPPTALLQSTIALSSNYNNQSTTLTGGESSSSAKRTFFVTSTEYTTLYPSTPTSSQAAPQPSLQSSSSVVASEPAIPTLTRSSTPSSTEPVATETPSSSTPPALPTSSLLPPPIIVITPSAPESSEPAVSSTQTAEQPSSGGGGFAYPTQQPAESSNGPSAPPSSSAEAPSVVPSPPSGSTPATTSPPSSSSSAEPSPALSSASSGPLVVVPIDSSQIFTVTETETTTTTEKETVTVTATVTA